MPTKLLGSEFQINFPSPGLDDGLDGNQEFSHITTLSDGRFAVVFDSEFLGSPSNLEADAVILNPDGSFSKTYIDVFPSSGNQQRPATAALPDDSFGVVFQNERHANGNADADPYNITYERVSASGTLIRTLSVADFNNGDGNDNVVAPAIATLADGRQIVAYERINTSVFTAGGPHDDIDSNVVSADGFSTLVAANAALLVSNGTAYAYSPDVAASGNDALIVDVDSAGTTLASANVSGRLFDGGTNTFGSSFTIADHASQFFTPKVVALDSHRYAVVYTDDQNVWGKIVDTSGGSVSLSPEFTIDQPATGFDIGLALAATADGGFIITWATSKDGSDYDMMARRYNSDGGAMGSAFTVNATPFSKQFLPSVAVSGTNVLFGWTDTGAFPGDQSPTSLHGQLFTITTPPDFNNNGVSDVLWRSSGDSLVLWDIDHNGAIDGSGALTLNGTPVSPGPSWSIAAESDFSGDGRADLLWRDASGALAVWTMKGSAITGTGSVVSSGGVAVMPDPASWSVAGAADFDGDGKSDILWRNSTTGEVSLWFMNDNVIADSADVTSGGVAQKPGPTWSVAGVGDFNGDGKSDIVWRDSATGEVALWQMNGPVIVGSNDVNAAGVAQKPGPTWSVVGVGDFNADGNADLLWRDSSSGSLAIWLMNGSTIIGSDSIRSNGTPIAPGANWHVVEIGDFNGDARTDILWRSDSGDMAEWQMKGTTLVSSFAPSLNGTPVAPDPVNWQIQDRPSNFA